MDYAEGRMGRVFAARLHHGEPVYQAIEKLCMQENVRSGLAVLLGGAKRATVVTGPKSTSGPIEPRLQEFDDAREMIALGTVYDSDEGPKLHLHAGFGRDDEALVGCPRYGLDTYLIVEAFIVEVTGIDARRLPDPATGLRLLAFGEARRVELP